MTVYNQRTQQQIADLVRACVNYWTLWGIADDKRREMQSELEQHLVQAVEDGKSLEAVVGSNPLALAHTWAQETEPRFSGFLAPLLRVLLYGVSIVSTTAILIHLFSQSFTFTFSSLNAFSFLFVGIFSLVVQGLGFLSPRIRSRFKRELLLVIATIFPAVLVSLIQHFLGTMKQWETAFLSWPWLVTGGLFVVSVVLFMLNFWSEFFPRNGIPFQADKLWRELANFAGVVLLTDVCLLLVWGV